MDRTLYPSTSYGVGRVYAEVQIKLNGASAPTVVEGQEVVKSVAHTGGTNVVTVTLKDSFIKVVAHAVDFRDDSGTGAYASLGTFTGEGSTAVPTAPITFKLQTFGAGGGGANDSSGIYVIALALRNSNIPPGSGN